MTKATGEPPRALPSVIQHVDDAVEEMFDFIIAQGDADYIGERVSQLEHSLQAAALAVEAKADEETILGALLHDVGRFIPAAEKMEKMIWKDGTDVGIQSHEVLGENYLRQMGFSEKISQLVGAHVMAKRYLTATDAEYYAALSEASKRTLKFQGGIFNEQQVKEAQQDPWLENKLAVRKWDDLAKEPDAVVPGLDTYAPMAKRQLLQSSSKFILHSKVYRLPTRPSVVIYINGLDSGYLSHGFAANHLPTLASFAQTGFHGVAKCAGPAFVKTHSTDMPIQDESTILLDQMHKRGVRVTAVTAEGNLQHCLHQGDSKAISLSVESADQLPSPVASTAKPDSTFSSWMGRPTRPRGSSHLSLYALDAGVRLLQEDLADALYITLSHIVPRPGSAEANEFFAAIDERVGHFVAAGAQVAVTGGNGMTAEPNATESTVPLLMSRRVQDPAAVKHREWWNFDAWDLLLNC